MNRKMYAMAVLAAGVLALVLAACGGSGSSSGSETSSEAASSKSGQEAEGGTKPVKAAPNPEKGSTFVSLGNVSGLGMVLVDSHGMTLYEFQKDQGTESSCYGECATFWPPLLSKGEPQPSNGADASKLGTTERKDGTMQVTYAGRPLYLFADDKKPGEANGNNVDAFGAEWYALQGSGETAEDNGGGGGGGEGTTTTEDSSTSGGGYGY